VYVHVDTTIHDVSIPFLQVWRLKRYLDFKLMVDVYVAVNPNISPPCIKIGISSDVDKRMQQLSVGQLGRWEEVYTYYYPQRWQAKCVENQLHSIFHNRNCKNTCDCSGREMFFASPHHVNEVVTTTHVKPDPSHSLLGCETDCYHKNNISTRLDEDEIIKEYIKWINSDDDSVKEYQKLLRHKNKRNEDKKHLIELMEFMDDIAPDISDGQYLKATNILKNMY
jgi:hypothetical protein